VLKNFFLTCSGVDKNLMNGCAAVEQNKFVCIGATFFFTAIMAILQEVMLYTPFLIICIQLFSSESFGDYSSLLFYS
jgi:hypothetical protein